MAGASEVKAYHWERGDPTESTLVDSVGKYSGISRDRRRWVLHNRNAQGCTIWFTGLSGAGKTTIAFALEEYLLACGTFCYALDGDNVRAGLCRDLDFSEADCIENNRRVAEVAKLFADAGAIAVCSLISPLRIHRKLSRRLHMNANLAFFEVFVDTPLDECEKRDTKGLYARAHNGKLPHFMGINCPYEKPEQPDLTVHTISKDKSINIITCIQAILDLLASEGVISAQLASGAVEYFQQRDDQHRSDRDAAAG